MRPADHPEFFRRAPPEGRSRESTIRLDAGGRFWHDGKLVAHPGLAKALHTWIARHPDNGRPILNNGYDWTYFAYEDAPYLVQTVRVLPDQILLGLSDGTEEPLVPAGARVGAGNALYVQVKARTPGGPFEAKLTPHAQTSLSPALVETDDGGVGIRIGDVLAPVRM